MKTKILSLAALISIGLISCQKSNDLVSSALNEEQILKSTEIAISDLKAESISDESCYEAEFYANSEQELRGIAGKKGRLGKLIDWRKEMRYQMGQCPDVSIDTAEAGYPIIITLNYGDSTVLENGRVLSGIITVEISGPKFTDGTTRTISYSDFSIDSVSIEGSIVETFTGDNITSRMFSVVGDLSITLPDGTVLDRVINREHEWLEGIDNMGYGDDVIQITGSVTTTSSTGDVYTKIITEPLLRLGSCKYIVQGKTQLTLNGEVISEIDFGNGDCDEIATLTTGGETIDIILKGKTPKADRSEKAQGNMNKGKKGKGK
jgi:hypothetical protein